MEHIENLKLPKMSANENAKQKMMPFHQELNGFLITRVELIGSGVVIKSVLFALINRPTISLKRKEITVLPKNFISYLQLLGLKIAVLEPVI